MEIINNRYKVESGYEENLESDSYIVSDLWDGNKKTLLRVINNDHQESEEIEYFIRNFLYLTSVKHNNIISNGKFDIIHTIDNKRVRKNQYFYTSEFIEPLTLEQVINEISLDESLSIAFQILNIMSYLHFRGIVYKFINPRKIFILKSNDSIRVMLQDLATVNHTKSHSFYDDFEGCFISPEVQISQNNINNSSDFYSLGVLLNYIFNKNVNIDQHNELPCDGTSNKASNKSINLDSLIAELTKKDSISRVMDYNIIASRINKIFGTSYQINMKEARHKLNFRTQLIGRDKELKKILNINKEFENGIHKSKIVTIQGESGIGKTSILNEIDFKLRIKGKDVYYTDLISSDNVGLKPIIAILRQMIKDCDSKLIDKYGSELVKIIPELRFVNNIKPSSDLEERREKLRLYDRIANFVIDFMKNRPTYIMIDDLHNCCTETLMLLNYIIKNSSDSPLLIILAYNKKILEDKKELVEFINQWSSYTNVEDITLLRFDLQETAEAIKNILGIDYRPINFATRVINETIGNPRHIEEAMKSLYASGELYINEKGFWQTKDQGYTNLYIPSNVHDALKNQVDLLEKELYDVAKVIAIFNNPVSKYILNKMLNHNDIELDKIINSLVSMKILEEKVEDWGYTYDFYNTQLKRYIYHSIDKRHREEYHKVAARILEQVYAQENRDNADELLHHFTLSHQTDKAIEYAVELAKKMKGLMGNSQSILLWEKAYSLLADRTNTKKLEVLVNIGELYLLQGSNEKALNAYEEALECSIKLREHSFIVKCKKGIGEIFFIRSNIEYAEKYILEAKELAEKIGFTEGLLDSVILLNRIKIGKGEYENLLVDSKTYIKIAREQECYGHLGRLYNHIGIVNMNINKINLAKNYFERSIAYFKTGNDYFYSTKPINNIGVIYADFYDDTSMAMKYYEEGLEICNKYNVIQDKITFLFNIGEMYFRQDQYEKAKVYTLKAHGIAVQMEDENAIFRSNINLGEIYLNTGEYGKAFKQYQTVKEQYKRHPTLRQDLSNYYSFLSLFYYTLGQWEESKKYAEYTMANSTSIDMKLYLDSKSRTIIIKFYETNILDKYEIDDLRKSYENTNFIVDRRKNLLMLADIAITSGDLLYAKDILNEDEFLLNKATTEYIDIFRKLIIAKMESNSIDKFIELESQFKTNNYAEVELLFNKALGDSYLSNNQYYDSANHYLNALDILYKLGRKIPDEELKLTYILSRGIKYITNKINMIKSLVSNGQLKEKDNLKLHLNGRFEDYFDFERLGQLFNNENFIHAAYKQYNHTLLKNVNKIEDLLVNSSSNYKNNLDMILQYAMKETLARRGYILVYNEDTDELEPLISTTDFCNIDELSPAIAKVRQNNSGIVVRDTFKQTENMYMVLSSDIKALICMPIYKGSASNQKERIKERRRKASNTPDDIIGYIYLDTDRLINRFDFKRYKMLDALGYLSSINIDNYYLKVLSSIDKMTGTYTRKYFDIVFEEYLNKVKKNQSLFTVIMIDIDKFKNINDTFGHQKGDEILTKIGEVLRDNLRETDMIGRYGGEEFIIVLPHTDEDVAKNIAEKIRIKIEQTNFISSEYPITVSLGISIFPSHGYTRDELIERADQALYQAKENGRNRWVLWSSNIGNVKKRLDKLAGIVEGNVVQDQRNVLAMVEVIDLLNEDLTLEEKVYKFLGRLIEISEGNQGVLFTINDDNEIDNIYARQRFIDKWIDNPKYNSKIVKRVIDLNSGEYLIDWESIGDIDIITGIPKWQSIIVVPLTLKGKLRGVLQISVPIKEKEFDYNSYNFISTIGKVIAAMI